ncbi:MAG: GNAT family N-acetyltransferase [Nocardioides sp.]
MASDLQVRPALPSEYGAVTEITVAAYVDGGYIPPEADYVAELGDTGTRAAGAEVWVATDGEDRVLGSVTWCPAGSTWREIARDDEGEFRMLAVAADARGRGVGDALVRACLETARAAGLGGVAISTMDKMTDAHRLYQRLGFSRAPEADWSPVDGVFLLAFRIRF